MNLNTTSYIACFTAGCFVTFVSLYNYYERKIDEIELSSYKTNIERADKAIATERELHSYFNTKTTEISDEIKLIDLSCNNAANIMLNNDNTSKTVLSKSTKTSNTVSESGSECSCKNTAKFRKLYEQQLMIARDCDINAVYLNKLIDLYNRVSQ